MEYQPATSDRLSVSVSNEAGAPIKCSLVFNNFTAQVSATRGISIAGMIPLMNAIQVVIKRNSTAYTNTLSNLALNDSQMLGSFSPSGT